MRDIEPYKVENSSVHAEDIRYFWMRKVNAERLMSVEGSSHESDAEACIHKLETQRCRSHSHFLNAG